MTAGFFGAIYELALTRLLMNTVGDRPATTQYFALQSVTVSLAAGIAPILWGVALDSLRGVQITVAGVDLGAYAIFFGLQWLSLGVVLAALTRVKESGSTSTGTLLHHIFVLAPRRVVRQAMHSTALR